MQNIISIGVAVVLLVLVVNSVGCKKEYYETGGVTDRSNTEAPKEIASKNIVEFETMFFTYMDEDKIEGSIWDIEIKPNENGEYVLKVNYAYQYEGIVSRDILDEIQQVIDDNNLVRRNGVDKVTAALAPECGPWMIKALYDSGEKLYFYEDGKPEADWTSAIRKLVEDEIKKAGN